MKNEKFLILMEEIIDIIFKKKKFNKQILKKESFEIKIYIIFKCFH
jgi:hypothetical protein